MKTISKSKYDIQAEKFVSDANIKITKTYTGHRKYFDDDKERRSCWHITVTRGDKAFSYDFGQSVMESYEFAGERYLNGDFICPRFRPLKQGDFKWNQVKDSLSAEIDSQMHQSVRFSKTPPSDYSLLACMSSDSYVSETFEDWCGDFGYDTDSRKALDTFLKCQKISSDINRFFTKSEIEQLREIN
jgi:hypothetical protein